jgi:hypothetical protein
MKNLLIASAFGLLLSALPADAQRGRGHGANEQWGPGPVLYGPSFGPPPPPRSAYNWGRCPSPRHVFVPGHYVWRGNRYRWVNGYWAVPPRARAVWVPGYWRPQRGGYVFVNGYWR